MRGSVSTMPRQEQFFHDDNSRGGDPGGSCPGSPCSSLHLLLRLPKEEVPASGGAWQQRRANHGGCKPNGKGGGGGVGIGICRSGVEARREADIPERSRVEEIRHAGAAEGIGGGTRQQRVRVELQGGAEWEDDGGEEIQAHEQSHQTGLQ